MKWLCTLVLILLMSPLAPAQERSWETVYFPLKVGNRWTYRAGRQTVVVEVDRPEVFQRKSSVVVEDKTQIVTEKISSFVLKQSSGDKIMEEQIVVLADGVYRVQAAGKVMSPPVRFFKMPLQKGDRWDVETQSEGTTIKATFVAGEADVEVPAGKFKNAMTVSSDNLRIGGQTMQVEYWFVPNVGMVKARVDLGPNPSILELERFEQKR